MTTETQQTKQSKKLDKPILVITHANCDDGMGAAWAAWKKFGDKADYWFAPYGVGPPDVTGKEVYITDFSYPRETLIKMHSEAKSMLVLDHHETAENNLADLSFCHFDKTKSGAVLAWEHFHPNVPIGVLLYHIQDNDLWKFDCPKTKAFIMNLRSMPQTIETFNTVSNGLENKNFGDEFYRMFVVEGMALLRYFDNQLAQAIKSSSHDIVIDGVKGRVANLTGMFASEAGNEMSTVYKTFGMTYFIHSTGLVKCSLRSRKEYGCNVAKMGEKFGGGGHAAASGFTITKEKLMELLK